MSDDMMHPTEDSDEDAPAFHRLLPGQADDLQIRGWKCDHCEDTHVVIYLKATPPKDSGFDPFYGAFDLSEEAARKLLAELPEELEYPAKGVDGGICLPVVPF